MTKNYKYSLDPSSRKFICPNCNKKTFVKFKNNETNEYLNHLDGRCDRESKCGYFKKPTKNCITKNNNCVTKMIQPTYHNNIVLQQFCNTKQQSNFITYLLKHFESQKVLNAIKLYHIGTTNYWNCATVFWQIDMNNIIHGGKIMLYDCNTGKRVKEPYNHVSWIHKQLKLSNFILKQCLFGLHIIKKLRSGDTICIVESEKTAIIMSIVIPDFHWLATGSKTAFKEENLKVVKNYKIIAYPDKTEYQQWHKTTIKLNKQGFNIKCSDLLERVNIEEGGDLIDFLQIM